MKKFWCFFFMFWPIVAIYYCWIAPAQGWWFPGEDGTPATPLGERIDGLFYMILYIVTIVFIGTQIGLGYALWKSAHNTDKKALFTHGSHDLEVIWTIVPAGVLLFIALYQLDVWADYRVVEKFPEKAVQQPVAEVTARQFEWRIRYPDPSYTFKNDADVKDWVLNPRATDLYAVNDLHVPAGKPVLIHLRSQDVQHSFFVPEFRVKQDAVPGQVIPVWFEVNRLGKFELLCAELCGWGHYKMKALVQATSDDDYKGYLEQLKKDQFFDGVPEETGDEEDE